MLEPVFDLPGAQCFAAYQGTQHVALDGSFTLSRTHVRQVADYLVDSNDEGFIESGFDAEERTAKDTGGQRDAGGAHTVECTSNCRWHDDPWTPARLVETKRGCCTLPGDGPIAQPYRYSSLGPLCSPLEDEARRRVEVNRRRGAERRTFAAHKERRVDGGVELTLRLCQILDRNYVGSVEQELPDSSAGKRLPQLGRKQQSQYTGRLQQLPGTLHEKRCKVYLCAEPLTRAGVQRTTLPGGGSVDYEIAT
jgi:hypothetical protein